MMEQAQQQRSLDLIHNDTADISIRLTEADCSAQSRDACVHLNPNWAVPDRSEWELKSYIHVILKIFSLDSLLVLI